MKNYAIRSRRTGVLVKDFDTPIEAELEIRSQGLNPAEYEVAEKQTENIYETMPDGKTYITGVNISWNSYEET